MPAPLHERLAFDTAEGQVLDGARRYLLLRADVLMGLFDELPSAVRGEALQAFGRSVATRGADSLRAYAAEPGVDGEALQRIVEAAAASLGWGRWQLSREGASLALEVRNSPFAARRRPRASRPATPSPACCRALPRWCSAARRARARPRVRARPARPLPASRRESIPDRRRQRLFPPSPPGDQAMKVFARIAASAALAAALVAPRRRRRPQGRPGHRPLGADLVDRPSLQQGNERGARLRAGGRRPPGAAHHPRRRVRSGHGRAQRQEADRGRQGRHHHRLGRRAVVDGDRRRRAGKQGADDRAHADRPGRAGRLVGGRDRAADRHHGQRRDRADEEGGRQDGGLHRLFRRLGRPGLQRPRQGDAGHRHQDRHQRALCAGRTRR